MRLVKRKKTQFKEIRIWNFKLELKWDGDKAIRDKVWEGENYRKGKP